MWIGRLIRMIQREDLQPLVDLKEPEGGRKRRRLGDLKHLVDLEELSSRPALSRRIRSHWG